jgi:hypothetical protein
MLGWIPLLGPILQGLFNTASTIYGKFKDTQLGMREQEVAEAKISAQIIHDTNDDIGLRIMRDAALVFPVGWSALIGWDTIISYRWPDLMFHVNNYPDTVGYIPYAALAFLFGNIGMNIWRRK